METSSYWWAFVILFVVLLVIGIALSVARMRQRERAMLALKQQNAAYPTINAYGQSNMYSGAPQPVYGQGLQAVQAAQGVQVQQVPIPVAEAVPVSDQPGVAYATPNKVVAMV
jgi:hypothetical protein